MRTSFYLNLLLAACGLAAAVAGTPVMPDPLVEGSETKVRPVFPTGKTLLFPVSAYDDGGKLTITATSDNPKVFVRVKTGNPLMVFKVKQDASGSNAGIDTTAVFQLFRDLTPETAAYIGGFAQGGFYDTGNASQIFRIADFGAVDGQSTNSVIFQGGSTAAPDTRSSIGYTFDNEFSSAAIFSGSGQLAMANGGYSALGRGTNGSQYFITQGNVRQLDFKHTIFAQMTRGFGLLEKMRTAPSKALLDDQGNNIGTTPLTTVKVTSSSVVPQYIEPIYSNDATPVLLETRYHTDAVLVLSAIAPGDATITVKATNAAGLSATQSFHVTVQDDPRFLNTRPFMTQMADAVIPAAGQANIGFRVVDLERDYVEQTATLANNGSGATAHGISDLLGGKTNAFGFVNGAYARVNQGIMGMIGNPSFLDTSNGFSFRRYTGSLLPTVSLEQYEPLYRGLIDGNGRGVDNESGASVAVGEAALIAESVPLSGPPATAGTFVVARYRDTDPKSKSSDVTASINWGDGSALQTGTISADTLKPAANSYQVSGAHTYARAGTYDVVTTFTSTLGMRRVLRGTAVITTNTLRALGAAQVLPGPTVANPILATFTDTVTPPRPASAYVATIDWGDGAVTKGTIKAAGSGRYSVVGVHSYANPERYSLSIRIHRSGAAESEDAIAWSVIALTKAYGAEHLPPFSMARLVPGVVGVPAVVPNTLAAQEKYEGAMKVTRSTVGTAPNAQTIFNYGVDIVNTGNKPSKLGKMRLYLSLDKTVNKTAVGSNPADIPLIIKGLKTNEMMLPVMQPGQVAHYYFTKGKYGDFSLLPPLNENGSGYNLLVQLDYSDPLVDHLPVDKVAVGEKISGIVADKTFLATSEGGKSDTFTLKLDKAPTATVTVPLTLDGTGPNEGTLDKTEVVFTPSDWNVDHPVTVTGKKDSTSTTPADGTKTYQLLIGRKLTTQSNGAVFISFTTSDDPLFKDMEAPPILVSNADRDNNLKLTSSVTTYITTESATNASAHTKTISITLNKKPTADVKITISNDDNTEADIGVPGNASDPIDPNKKILTITPAEVTTVPYMRTFTITGKDDHIRDMDAPYKISFVVTSADQEFDGLPLPTLNNTNTDDGDLTGAPATP